MGSDSQVRASLEALRARVEGFRRFLEGLEPLVLPCTPTRRWVRGGNGSPYWYWYMVCKDGEGGGRSVYVGSQSPRGIRRSEYNRALGLAGRLSGLLDELERGLEEVERLEAELSEKARLASEGGGGAVRVEYACSGCGAIIMVVEGGLMVTREAVRELGGVCPRCGRILSEEPLRAETL